MFSPGSISIWFTKVKLGARNLLLHKLRSLLTMLGMILGVGSVIAMLAIGEGSKQEAIEQIRQLGAANIIVRSVKPEQNKAGPESSGSATQQQQQQSAQVLEYGLKYRDFDILTSTLPTLKRAVPISLLRRNAQYSRHRINNARVLGTTPDYVLTKNLDVSRGRFLTKSDMHKTANVAVLAAGAARRLFSYEDPLGKTLLLGEGAYRVVGVLETQDSGTARAGALQSENMDQDIYIPLTSAQRRFGDLQMMVRAGGRDFERNELYEITLTVHDEELVSQTASMARKILKSRHSQQEDYEVQVPLELLRQAEHEKRIWNMVLGSIGGISLLVGGIGIMNIMLATVTERTQEIGIRRAIGATRRDIISQFLVETVLLSSMGGMLGIFVGVSIPMVVSSTFGITTAVSPIAVLAAFGISVAVGIIFGIYPAHRAAWMDPIEALRHQ